MSADRVTIADLEFGVAWMDTYDPTDDNGDVIPEEQDNADSKARIIAWLEAEIYRRQEETHVRALVARIKRETGRTITATQARKALRAEVAKRQASQA